MVKAWTWGLRPMSVNPTALLNRDMKPGSNSSNQEEGMTGLEVGPCTAV